jgi:hypothetical protein
MRHIYRINTNDGSSVDGLTVSSRKAAIRELKSYRGWARAYLLDYGGDSWSVYGTRTECDADAHGIYADTVTRVRLDGGQR